MAAGVLQRMVEDLDGAPAAFGAPVLSRQWAARFFTPGDPGLQFWAAVLDIEPEALCEAVRRRLGQSRRPRH